MEGSSIKKKSIAMLLGLTMAAGMLSGCGKSSGNESGEENAGSGDKIEIEFVQGKGEAVETYEKVIAAFEKENPNITIKQTNVPDTPSVLTVRAGNGTFPDLLNYWPMDAAYHRFIEEGLLMDLTGKEYLKNVDEDYMYAVKAKDDSDKGIYMAPYNINFYGIYYNMDKFEEAGFEIPTTWAELMDIAQQIKDKGEVAFLLPNKDSWTVSQLWENLEGNDLGAHWDAFDKMNKGEASYVTIPEYRRGLEKMIELMDYCQEGSFALGYDQAINDFANGKGWMFIQSNSALPSIMNANPQVNLKFYIAPNDNGNSKAVQLVDTGFCVGAQVADDPEKMAAIDKFLSFAMSKEGAQLYTDNDRSPSCVTGVTLSTPEMQPAMEYIKEHGFEADGAAPPAGFAQTKDGKIQQVLMDKDIDGFLQTMADDWVQALENSK